MSEPRFETAPLPERDYQRHLEEGRFMLQRSRSSGRFVYYPRVAEPRTGATDLEWVEVSGLGTVYATEGVPPEQVRVGMAVRARIAREVDGALVVFDPVEGGSGASGAGATGGAR